MRHAFSNGLNSNKGEKNGKARLCESEVLEIYEMRLQRISNKEIAAKYGITDNMVNLIGGKYVWEYLLKDLPDVQRNSRSARLTQEQKDRALSLRNSGMTSKEVSELMGITLNQAESVTRSPR